MAERETSLEQRTRQDLEKAHVRQSRQLRLGHVSAPPEEAPEESPKEDEPAPKRRRTSKSQAKRSSRSKK